MSESLILELVYKIDLCALMTTSEGMWHTLNISKIFRVKEFSMVFDAGVVNLVPSYGNCIIH